MDTFLTTVVAGVVVAVVGAIAAFYLGGVREKHKPILAKQAEEQRRLEEWRREELGRMKERKQCEQQREEERKQRVIERRAEALDDIRVQALYFANAFRTGLVRQRISRFHPKMRLSRRWDSQKGSRT